MYVDWVFIFIYCFCFIAIIFIFIFIYYYYFTFLLITNLLLVVFLKVIFKVEFWWCNKQGGSTFQKYRIFGVGACSTEHF